MPRHRQLLVVLICSLLCLVCLGMGKRSKGKSVLVTFHVETSQDEAPKFAFPHPIGTPDNLHYFKKIPSISNDDIDWFYSFPSDDGLTFGVAFKLKRKGTDSLQILSAENQGRFLLASIAPGHSSVILIDKPVTDGVVVVWEGLSAELIEQMRKTLTEKTSFAAGQQP